MLPSIYDAGNRSSVILRNDLARAPLFYLRDFPRCILMTKGAVQRDWHTNADILLANFRAEWVLKAGKAAQVRTIRTVSFLLCGTIGLTLATARPALALLPFQSGSVPYGVPPTSKEPSGHIALIAPSSGNISAGSTIMINYGTPVYEGTGIVQEGCSNSADAGLDWSYSGNVVTITFLGDFHCNSGEYIAISDVCFNSIAVGNGNILNASLSASGGITFTSTLVPVAQVQSSFTSRAELCSRETKGGQVIGE